MPSIRSFNSQLFAAVLVGGTSSDNCTDSSQSLPTVLRLLSALMLYRSSPMHFDRHLHRTCVSVVEGISIVIYTELAQSLSKVFRLSSVRYLGSRCRKYSKALRLSSTIQALRFHCQWHFGSHLRKFCVAIVESNSIVINCRKTLSSLPTAVRLLSVLIIRSHCRW